MSGIPDNRMMIKMKEINKNYPMANEASELAEKDTKQFL
jgi:hypothetical protein